MRNADSLSWPFTKGSRWRVFALSSECSETCGVEDHQLYLLGGFSDIFGCSFSGIPSS